MFLNTIQRVACGYVVWVCPVQQQDKQAGREKRQGSRGESWQVIVKKKKEVMVLLF